MSKSGALDLAARVGGKIEKKEVKSAVQKQVFSTFSPLCFLWFLDSGFLFPRMSLLCFLFYLGFVFLFGRSIIKKMATIFKLVVKGPKVLKNLKKDCWVYLNWTMVVCRYETYHAGVDDEERKANYTDMVNKYYDLATSFYEYGWGESFHFAPRWKAESLRESIKRHEHFLALQLGLKKGQKVLDVGCGIGGPLREIARFSDTLVTGVNNNEYQITRGEELNCIAEVEKTCNFVKTDFMKMPFSDNTFDAIFAIEATCHAPDVRDCYKEIFRVLKPGQCFAAYEWCITDSFDPRNLEHQTIKRDVELGNGLPDIRSMEECLEALQLAGFEVIWEKDIAVVSPLPWYLPLDKSQISLSNFRVTALGRFFTRNMVKTLEFLGLAPEGSQRVQAFLEQAADALVAGGKRGIFTPMYFFLARKPL